MADEKRTNIIDLKSKQGITDASEKIMDSAKTATVAFIDKELDFAKKLPDVLEGDIIICDMNEEEIDMLTQVTLLKKQMNDDMDTYEEQVEENLGKLLEDPEAISAKLIKNALYNEVENELVIRLTRRKAQMDLLRSTMFWRIQDRTGVFDHALSIRKGFKIVQGSPVNIIELEEAAQRLKKMQFIKELENSDKPDHLKKMIMDMVDNIDDL